MPNMTQQEVLDQSNRLNSGHVQKNKDLIPKHIEANCKLSWDVHRGPENIRVVILIAAGWIDWPRIDEILERADSEGARDTVAVCCADRVYEMMPAERRVIVDYIWGADMFGRPMAKPPKGHRNPIFVFESRTNPDQVKKWPCKSQMVITRDSTFFSENQLLWQLSWYLSRRNGKQQPYDHPYLIACGGNVSTMALSTIGHHWPGVQQVFFFGHDFAYWGSDPECGNENTRRGPHLKGVLHTGAYLYTKPDYLFFASWTERFCRECTLGLAQQGRKIQFISMSIGILGRNENGYPEQPPEHLMLAGINQDLEECAANERAGGGLESDKYIIIRVDSDPPAIKGNRYGATWPVNISAKGGNNRPELGAMGHWTNDSAIVEEVRQKAGQIDETTDQQKVKGA